MNIENKLALVESSQRIVGIKEGMFVRFYEQSLFGWQQWVSKQDQLPTLKVLRKKVKKLNGREVLYGGLPIESLKQAGIDIGTEAVIELEIIIDFSEWSIGGKSSVLKWTILKRNYLVTLVMTIC
ncbi:hypothetical protein [Vibrio harveyi]|uniref:hypothetical protein n=1 Tax=Vibrio harveyi TaxID=669 RepID=UPI001F1D6FA8|nr:hypothetical protein [Vibrio harveyi]